MKGTLSGLFLLICSWGFAQTVSPAIKNLNLHEGVALDGYDPVAYFTEHKAVKGDQTHAVTIKGVKYFFAAGNDEKLFRSDPDRYQPQYGGWCAYAMGHDGSKVDVDPETFKITDGKLFLFYNKYFNNTLKSWNKNEAKLHEEADINWRKF